jgi:hypothetical protein
MYMQKKLRTKADSMMLLSKTHGLTENKIQEHFLENGVHPLVVNHLQGAGFFSSLLDGIGKTAKFIIKNKDNIEKGIKTGIDVYKTGKSIYDQIKGGKVSRKKGGMLSAGNIPSAGKLSAGSLEGAKLSAGKLSAGKLNPAHRKRIDKIGQYMRQGMTMKEAWAEYRKQNPK